MTCITLQCRHIRHLPIIHDAIVAEQETDVQLNVDISSYLSYFSLFFPQDISGTLTAFILTATSPRTETGTIVSN